MFYETSQFLFTTQLELNWLLIQQELIQLQPECFAPWMETALYNQGWDVFGLYAFGQRLDTNCCLCPETTKLVEAIPGMTTAGFSSLAPGTQIAPHVGYSNTVLRCHLGLVTPQGCGIRVGTQTKQWTEGKCLIFDDTVEHEAWNNSNRYRIILLVDFKKPDFISHNAYDSPSKLQKLESYRI